MTKSLKRTGRGIPIIFIVLAVTAAPFIGRRSDLPGVLITEAALSADYNARSSFDGLRAFSHLRALVEIGPRPPGSKGAAKAQAYIMSELKGLGLAVREQPFDAVTPVGPKKMKNIIGIIPGKKEGVIIIGAHYDTKLFERFSFVGANDGASGPAVLLEFARCIPANEIPFTVWLVFFDGEEAFVKWTAADSLYGSRHMVRRLSASGELPKIKAMLLLDMVGDADLSIEAESHSTRWLRQIVWKTAARLGYASHFTNNRYRILDDHLPFLEQGIPSLVIIDFHYGKASRTNKYWHTEQDSIERVSPVSLKIVGDVVLDSLPEIAERLGGDIGAINDPSA